MTDEYDRVLAEFLSLWETCKGDAAVFCREAQQKLGYSAEELDWINLVIGSAQFRAALGNLVGGHTTDCEDDPWFLAALRRCPGRV